MKIKTLTVNGLFAAMYIVVSMIIQPIAFSSIQFRVPEIFNHLVVFNKKYIYGVVLGVFLSNLFFSPMMPYDIVFGVAQSIIGLVITIFTARFIKSVWKRMWVNTIVFTVTMFIIAFELKLALNFPFFYSWGTAAVGEFVVMAIGMPIMMAIHKKARLDTLIEE
ncbi:QueT transporter family protein [Priestia koreensis]|uniref:QueT transporter family protein n=1 Tax=Priestia koreensis TaxID=284581 RepID=A0A0M0L5S8_9BACI|nr:QueT transporter family protein [Priestia koreensis]KOO46227.1 hypothetical protein AMD01_10220 [Priestia koreensis]